MSLPPRRDGFTLIEIMITLTVLGVLAAIAIPRFLTLGEDAKEAEAGPILRHIYLLEERHHIARGAYASTFSGLEGSAEPVDRAKFYEFRLRLTPEGFLACALPRAGFAYLETYQIDHEGVITKLPNAAACTGSAP